MRLRGWGRLQCHRDRTARAGRLREDAPDRRLRSQPLAAELEREPCSSCKGARGRLRTRDGAEAVDCKVDRLLPPVLDVALDQLGASRSQGLEALEEALDGRGSLASAKRRQGGLETARPGGRRGWSGDASGWQWVGGENSDHLVDVGCEDPGRVRSGRQTAACQLGPKAEPSEFADDSPPRLLEVAETRHRERSRGDLVEGRLLVGCRRLVATTRDEEDRIGSPLELRHDPWRLVALTPDDGRPPEPRSTLGAERRRTRRSVAEPARGTVLGTTTDGAESPA